MYEYKKPRYSINDLIELLGIGRAQLYEAINSGALQTHKIGKRRFACAEDLHNYLQWCKQESQQ